MLVSQFAEFIQLTNFVEMNYPLYTVFTGA
jgi:hypothetical protein